MIFQEILNRFNASIGRNQDFEKLIEARDIDRIMSKMDCRESLTRDAIHDYDPKLHEINKREDKYIRDKKGNHKRTIKRWKLPLSYPVYINEIALVFLYGRPVRWTQISQDTDEAFSAFLDVIKHTHFNSKVRQAKRYAGAETQSALLFHVQKKSTGKTDAYGFEIQKPDVQIRVLSASKGDTIYARWDKYENLVSAGWEYYLYEEDENIRHFDLFTPKVTYKCRYGKNGWEVLPEENPIGKIPLILFLQDKEWKGVEPEIEREEYIASRTADTNDYFADPQQVMNADVIKNMPEKDDENKTFIVSGDVKANEAVSYVTWDNASQSKKDEIAWLQNHILSKTFTPNIDFDNMKSLSNVSGKALKQMMILADIKAKRHMETHDELMDRTANLIKAIVGNVLDVKMKAQMEALEVGHEFQEPFGEDIADVIKNITQSVDAEILSKESAVELSPLTKDADTEKKRLEEELNKSISNQRDIFTQMQQQNEGVTEGEEELGAE